MLAKDYFGIVRETAVYKQRTESEGIMYCYLGIIDERDELFDVILNGNGYTRTAFVSEMGDVVWYVTATALELKLDPVKILSTPQEFYEENHNIYNIEKLAGPIKKLARDEKPIDLELAEKVLMYTIAEMKFGMGQENIEWGDDWVDDVSFGEVMETNYNKLSRRKEMNLIHGDGDYREQNGQQ